MKRLLLALVILIFFVGLASGETVTVYEPKFQPQSPEVMAQGGSFTANAGGFNALYTNPAGFSSNNASLTLAAVNPWLYAFPDPETIAAAESAVENPAEAVSILGNLLLNGTGVGAQVGLGFVGSGFGLGVIAMNDTFAYGPNLLGVRVDTAITVGVIAGVSFPIRLGGLTITPGGAVRPMYRIRAYEVGITNFLDAVVAEDPAAITAEVHAGMGLGIDLGVNASFGPVTAALAIRDFGGTTFDFGVMSAIDAFTSLESGALPEGTPIEEDIEFVIPMSFHYGLEFHPDLGGFAFLIDPSVHAEYVQTIGPEEEESFWMNLHLGTEIRVLRMFRLRAGLNQGYTTLGAGIKLLFLEAHVAYFARELGSYPGSRQNQGVTAEVALRF